MSQPRATGVPPRFATAADWAASPLILLPGEEGVAWDTGVRKYGDGTHRWTDLTAPATGSAVDLGPLQAAVTNVRQMILARDPRLQAVEDVAEEAETVHADLYARIEAVTQPPGGEPDIPDPTVIFENGLV